MRVLIIEDSPTCAELCNNMMRRLGMETVLARSGIEAMSRLVDSHTRYDLILSDIFMPGMDGLEFYQTLQQNPKLAKTPIILASNAADVKTVTTAARLGCRHFLTKPLKRDKVQQKIAELFPDLKIFLKDRQTVLEEMSLSREEYTLMVDEFFLQTTTALDLIGQETDTARLSAAINVLTDSASLLGTDDLIETINRFKVGFKVGLNIVNTTLVDSLDRLKTDLFHLRERLAAERDEEKEKKRNAMILQEHEERLKNKEETERLQTEEIEFAGGAEAYAKAKTEVIREKAREAARQRLEEKKKQWIEGAEKGIVDDQFSLGMAYLRGIGFEKNESAAMDLLGKAAAQHHPPSLCQLGLMVLRSKPKLSQEEWNLSLRSFQEASSRGNKEAQYWYSEMSRRGPGSEEAVTFVAKAQAGEAPSQYRIGVLYDRGLEVPQNVSEAIYWLKESAIQGHTNAQYRLALIYQEGRGDTGDDIHEAIYWFERATEQGHVDAEYSLGRIYHLGMSHIKKDRLVALKWYKKAAWNGSRNAQFCLGQLAEEEGDLIDYKINALTWYLVSAANGYALASKRVAELQSQIPQTAIAQAEGQARQILQSLGKTGSTHIR